MALKEVEQVGWWEGLSLIKQVADVPLFVGLELSLFQYLIQYLLVYVHRSNGIRMLFKRHQYKA